VKKRRALKLRSRLKEITSSLGGRMDKVPWWESNILEEEKDESGLSVGDRNERFNPSSEGLDPFVSEITTRVLSRIGRGGQVLDSCETIVVENVRLKGKSLNFWKEELTVEIPETDDDPDAIGEALGSVAKAIQIAEQLLAAIDLKRTLVENVHEADYTDKYTKALESSVKTKKLSAEKVKQITLADPEVDLSLSAVQLASAITEYFRKIVNGLEKTRKTLESRVMLLGIKMKHLRNY